MPEDQGGDAKSGKAATPPVLESRPVDSKPADVTSDPKPVVASSLVGDKAGGLPPAPPRSESPGPSPIPAVAKTAPKPEPKMTESTSAKPTPVTTPQPVSTPHADDALARRLATLETRVEAMPNKVRKTGFWPVMFGGVVAAGLGAAATYWAIPHLPEQWQPVRAAALDVDALTQQATAAGQSAGAEAGATAGSQAGTQAGAEAGAEAAQRLLAELPAPEAPEPGQPAPVMDTAALDELAAKVESQAAQIAALDQALAARPAASGGAEPAAPTNTASAAALAGLEATVQTLQQRVGEQGAQLQELAARPALDPATAEQIQKTAAEAEAVRQQLQQAAETTQAELTKAQQEAAAAGRRAQGIAALALLQNSLETGGARDAALADLQAAGVDTPAAVTLEVASLNVLQQEWDAAARAGLRASLQAGSPDQGVGGAVANFLKVQTGARSVAPKEGADPDAILSRAGSLVASGNIAGALAEIDALPDAGQQAMTDWTGKAQGYVAAQQAVADLAAGLR